MKLAVFIKNTTLHSSFGGLEAQNEVLCNGLAKLGHTVYVFSPRWELSKGSIDKDGVKYIFIDAEYKSKLGLGFLFKNNWVTKSFSEFMTNHSQIGFDLIVGQSSAALGVIKHKNEIHIPVISISHGTIIGEFLTRLQNLQGIKSYMRLLPDLIYIIYNFFGRQREFVTHSNHVIAVSNAVKDALVEETFLPEGKVSVIYNGINPTAIVKKEIYSASHNPKILYFGRMEESKGINDLVVAFSKLPSELGASLTFIGDGTYLNVAKKLVLDLDLSQKVTFFGKLALTEVAKTLCEYDLFVLPSRRVEGFPMTVVEAMFAGLPVVGANIGGVPEAIINNVTGKLYKSGNINELLHCLLEVCSDSKLRESMGKNGFMRALSEFSLDVMLTKYLELFEREIK